MLVLPVVVVMALDWPPLCDVHHTEDSTSSQGACTCDWGQQQQQQAVDWWVTGGVGAWDQQLQMNLLRLLLVVVPEPAAVAASLRHQSQAQLSCDPDTPGEPPDCSQKVPVNSGGGGCHEHE